MSTQDYRLILLSLLIASVLSLAAFSLVSRIDQNSSKAAKFWLLCGAMGMGSLLWTAQIAGLWAFNAFAPVSWDLKFITISWMAAVTISWLALEIASRPVLTLSLLITSVIMIGAGISGMYYSSVYAIQIADTASPTLFTFFVSLAAMVSIVALFMLFWRRAHQFPQAMLSSILGLVLISALASGAYYIDISAADFTHAAIYGALAGTSPALLAMVIAIGAAGLIVIIFISGLLAARISKHSSANDVPSKEANYELSRMAMLDTLTQLPNRRFFQQQLEIAILRNSRLGNSLAVAFIDLDGFKPINDTLGHHIGDEVLRAVAKRLNAAVRGCDVVARIGGDEFVALIEDIQSDQDIVPIVERIINSLRDTFFVDPHEITISASVGIAVYPRDGDMTRLMVCADAAMYRAKSDGKNQFRFFDSDIELASDRLLEMQRDLRHALSKDEFKLHFQPKVDSRTYAPVGVEALLRWDHPIKGTISPAAFIPAAERFGLINQIGDWVIEESCRIMHRMRSQGIMLNISINLSPQQFRNANLVTNMLEVLERFDLPPSSLMFEISESSAMHNPEQFNTLLADFKAAGIEIALDDFGIGHSSLAHLQNIKVSVLKLHRTFIAEISANKQSRAIVDAVVRLAHALEMTVVAEGVETEEQRKILTELGCNHLQGYLFSRPVPEEKLAGLMRQLAAIKQSPGEPFPAL